MEPLEGFRPEGQAQERHPGRETSRNNQSEADALEQVLSNRFYQDYDTAAKPSLATRLAGRGAPAERPRPEPSTART